MLCFSNPINLMFGVCVCVLCVCLGREHGILSQFLMQERRSKVIAAYVAGRNHYISDQGGGHV